MALWSAWLQLLLVAVVFMPGTECIPLPVSEWGHWSPCTRSCGGGVSVQERECLNATACDGVEKQYRSCCVQPCSPDTPSFREELCASYNSDGLKYRPLQEELANECQQLRCVEELDPTKHILLTYFKDGMPCTSHDGRRGVCLGNMCASVGCDGILGSQKIEDSCLQCVPATSQEESNTCVRYAGHFLANSPQNGYVQVQVIPSGATSIAITHVVKPGKSSLALRASTEDHFFSGSLSGGEQYSTAGTTFHFQAGDLGPHPSESLVARGPLNHDVIVEVYATDTIPEVSYVYHLAKPASSPANASMFPEDTNLTLGPGHVHDVSPPEGDEGRGITWGYADFSSCSVTCGVGVRTSLPRCVDSEYGRQIPDEYCKDLQQPLPIQQRCHTVACPPRWVVMQWSPCSQSCGLGQQERLATCQQVESDGLDVEVSTDLCPSGDKPEETRTCNAIPCHPQWSTGAWGECSAVCGPGIQQRKVACVDNSTDQKVSPQYCIHLPLPPSTQTCTTGPCSPSTPENSCHWSPARWHRCSKGCGHGIQDRNINCRNDNGHKVDVSCCEGLQDPRPVDERDCLGVRNCRTKWVAEEWGECMGMCECGVRGAKQRNVTCMAEVDGEEVEVASEHCNDTTRPESTEICDPCPQWVTGPWGPCSTTCGPGLRPRNVSCQQDGQPASGCEDVCLRPSQHLVCTNNPTCGGIPPPDPITTPPPIVTTPTSAPPSECVDQQHPSLDCRLIAQVGLCSGSSDYYRLVCCASCQDVLS